MFPYDFYVFQIFNEEEYEIRIMSLKIQLL